MRDAKAEGIGYRFQEAPHYDCVEQVYVHDAVEDTAGKVRAALINRKLEAGAGLGIAIEFQIGPQSKDMPAHFAELVTARGVAPSTIDAAGIYVRRLNRDEQEVVARRLATPMRGKDDQPFRP